MAIIFFCTRDAGEAGERLLKVIESQAQGKMVEAFGSIASLEVRLICPTTSYATVILMPASYRELLRLNRLRELLVDASVILVLPDEAEETLAEAHRFYPRYICSHNNGFHDVAIVMQKMVMRHNLLRASDAH